MKRVLCLIVDALASNVVNDAFDAGRLPNLRAIADRGVRRDSTAVFPSVTPAATASLVTGEYPATHGIAGAHWIDEEAESVAYYGDDLWVILREGIDDFLNDFLVTLNYERLLVPGVFREVERSGRTAACINYLWFRGDHPHPVREPWLVRLMPGVSMESEVCGPKWLQLGDFVSGMPDGVEPTSAGGIRRRFGFNDERTLGTLRQLIDVGLPDFTLAYLPDNDFESHDRGPREAVDVLERLDASLGELFEDCGGLDRLLETTAIVVTGDHSQSPLVNNEEDRAIELADVLDEFAVGAPGAYWTDADELLVCPNLRAAQLYARDDDVRERVVARLLEESRIDQVLRAPDADGWFEVLTANRGELRFRRADDGLRDAHGNAWACHGDLGAIDAESDGGRLVYRDYPNALERIEGGFGPRSARLWVTARLGYEFRARGTAVHAAGSHGSLHRRDSTSPLLVAGHDDVPVPESPRAVDVVPLCRAVLG